MQSERPAIPLDPTTVVRPAATGKGYTAVRTQPDGARVVLSARKLPNGSVGVVAFREQKSATGQTVSKVFTDGHRVTQGRTFTSEAVAGGPHFVKYNNGLRAAFLPNGKPLYSERFVARISDGTATRVVQRTTYTSVVAQGGGVRWVPVVRYYPLAVSVGGIDYYGYEPMGYAPEFWVPFYRPFAVAILVGPQCLVCRTGGVVYEQPVTGYADPMDLVGDNVIAAGVSADAEPPAEGGYALASADDSTRAEAVAPPPEMLPREAQAQADTAAASQAAADLQRSMQTDAQSNPALTTAVASAPIPAAAPVATAAEGSVPLRIPEDAHVQLRKEVRFDVAAQQNQHALLLPNIVASDFAKIFVFQAASPIDVNITATGDQCTLSGGDLLSFARVPAPNDSVVQMKVISSRAGHCSSSEIVELGVSDAQDMLNAFSERVERETKRVNACMAPDGACVRT